VTQRNNEFGGGLINRVQVEAAPPSPDDYLSKLAKYIPGEATALFLLLTAIEPSWIVATSVLCWAFTPLFLWFAGRCLPDVAQPRLWSYPFAAVAFPFGL
jgi:hypothetical protein